MSLILTKEALRIERIENVIVDAKWRDKKGMSILDLPETHLDMKMLVSKLADAGAAIYEY